MKLNTITTDFRIKKIYIYIYILTKNLVFGNDAWYYIVNKGSFKVLGLMYVVRIKRVKAAREILYTFFYLIIIFTFYIY